MREAIGGTWLLYFFFIFVFIYIAFMAVIMNYASAYRTNNYIVSKLEEYEGNIAKDTLKREVMTKYKYSDQIDISCSVNSVGTVYKVKTYIMFTMPLMDIKFKTAITNESKSVYMGLCDKESGY